MSRERIGVGVFRTGPLHDGHRNLLSRMCSTCTRVLFLNGNPSFNEEERTRNDMWLTPERYQMVKNIFGDRVEVSSVTNIGGRSAHEWGEHVVKTCVKAFGVTPTDYFAGSYDDALWLSAHFALPDKNEAFDQNLIGTPLGTLHILNRHSTGDGVSGTGIRTRLLLNDRSWMSMVPAVNHDIVMEGFEKYLKAEEARRDRTKN